MKLNPVQQKLLDSILENVFLLIDEGEGDELWTDLVEEGMEGEDAQRFICDQIISNLSE